MVDRDHRDLIVIDSIDDNIGETPNRRESKVLKGLAEQFGRPTNLIERPLDALEQFVAQSAALAVISRLWRQPGLLRLAG